MDKFLSEIFDLVEEPKTISSEYRVYFDPKTLAIVCFSQEQLDMPYAVISKEWYESYRPDLFEIVDGKVFKKEANFLNKNRLKPGKTYATLKGNMQIAVDKDCYCEKDYWDRRE
jgi:hypothetical protein